MTNEINRSTGKVGIAVQRFADPIPTWVDKMSGKILDGYIIAGQPMNQNPRPVDIVFWRPKAAIEAIIRRGY